MAEEITTIATRVRKAIAGMAGVSLDLAADDKTLADLGCDSLDAVECVMEIEDQFDIVIETTDADKLAPAPIREWIQYIEARVAAQHV